MELTRGSVKEMASKLGRWKAIAERGKEKAEEVIGQTLQAVEVVGSASAMSYANEAYGKGELQLMGAPADLCVGLGIHVAAFLVKSKYGEHAHNIADGLLCAFGVREAIKLGKEAAAKTSTGFAPAGQFRTGFAPAGSFAPGQQQNVGYAPAGAFVPQGG